MFERRIMQDLRRWADNAYRKPLILRGARQVGETIIVRQFGKGRVFAWLISPSVASRSLHLGVKVFTI